MSSRGRGKDLTRPAWMQQGSHPQPSVTPSSALQPVSDWSQARAPDGRTYWYSRSTGRTTWADPSPAPVSEQAVKSQSVWKQHHADDGRVYYYNSATQKTQWHAPPEFVQGSSKALPSDLINQEKPVGAVSPLPPQQDCDLAPGWAENRTPDGRVYYYHATTRETRWQKPTVSPPEPQPAQPQSNKRPHESVASVTSKPLASESEWATHRTADGKVYFYNKQTRETSWTNPATSKPASEQPSPKRPRLASNDLRSIVNRRAAEKENASQKSHVTRRPRKADGRAMSDKEAEQYFVSRASKKRMTLKSGVVDEQTIVKSDEVMSPRKDKTSEEREEAFFEMLSERGIKPDDTWLQTMATCASDMRYQLLLTHGSRKAAWTKFCQKARKARRRQHILSSRRSSEEFLLLMEEVFGDEPDSSSSLSRCRPQNVQSFENDSRYKAVDQRERDPLIHCFFATRTRKITADRARKRREGMRVLRSALDGKIHPSLSLTSSKIAVAQTTASSQTGAETEENGTDSSAKPPGDDSLYFTDRTPFRQLDEWLISLPETKSVDRSDRHNIIDDWRRDVLELVEKKRHREREARRVLHREHRANFRNGVEKMILDGQIPITARWKDVSDVVAKQDFAKPELELDARPVDLFEDGRSLFEEKVHKRRDEFKRLLREESIEVNEETSIEHLSTTSSLAAFFQGMDTPVAKALLLDRQRKESKRKQKEKDRALADFEELIRRCNLPLETDFATATASWTDIAAYNHVLGVVGQEGVQKAYSDFMEWRRTKEQKRMKRKIEPQPLPMAAIGIPAMEGPTKRARLAPMMHTHQMPFVPEPPREEENGWAAAVSAKPISEAELLKAREKRKREILESLTEKR